MHDHYQIVCRYQQEICFKEHNLFCGSMQIELNLISILIHSTVQYIFK